MYMKSDGQSKNPGLNDRVKNLSAIATGASSSGRASVCGRPKPMPQMRSTAAKTRTAMRPTGSERGGLLREHFLYDPGERMPGEERTRIRPRGLDAGREHPEDRQQAAARDLLARRADLAGDLARGQSDDGGEDDRGGEDHRVR